MASLRLPVLVSMIGLILAGAPAASAQSTPEQRLAELGLALPETFEPIGNYVPAATVGNLVFIGGHSECGPPFLTGKVGADVTLEEAYQAARLTGLCLLASLKAEIGDLSRVERIVRVFGMVNAVEDFADHPKVINGCSDFLVEVFGERGRHTRAAVGVGSLPMNLSVEIEMVVQLREE